LYNLKG